MFHDQNNTLEGTSEWEHFVAMNGIPKRFECPNPALLEEELQKELASWMENRESLVITGGVGSGKTYFLSCLLRSLIEISHRYIADFTTERLLNSRLEEAVYTGGYPDPVIKRKQAIEYLFIDDFGMQRKSEKVRIEYDDIFDYRWARLKPTVISTNLSVEQLKHVCGARIFSRLKDFKRIIFSGADLRGNKTNINSP